MKSLTSLQKAQMTQRFAQRWLPLIAERKLLPLIERRFALEDAAQAHQCLETEQPFGKLVLECA
ncbi:hypothetical protein D3C79_946110 [compost metagenome]